MYLKKMDAAIFENVECNTRQVDAKARFHVFNQNYNFPVSGPVQLIQLSISSSHCKKLQL